MAVLGTVGIADNGTYNPTTIYKKGNFVSHNDSTWLVLLDDIVGITPTDDGVNWKYLAKGASVLNDTEGLLGTIGSSVTNQSLTDKIANMGNTLDTTILPNANKYIFVSDSYGTVTTPSWIDYCAGFLGLGSSDFYQTSVPGACFTGRTGNVVKFVDMLTDLGSSISNKAEVKSIVVGGGFNDRGMEESNILANISSFVTYANTNYPNAKIYVADIGWTFDSQYIFDLFKVLPAYSKCSEYGAKFLSGVQYTMHNKAYFVSDLVHPNADGCKAIGRNIYNALTVGGCNVDYPIYTSTALYTGIVQTSTVGGLYQTLHNDFVTFRINAGEWAWSPAVNIICDNTTLYHLLDINGGYMVGCEPYPPLNNVTVLIKTTSNNVQVQANFMIYNNGLYATFTKGTSSTSFETISAVGIKVPRFKIQGSAMEC